MSYHMYEHPDRGAPPLLVDPKTGEAEPYGATGGARFESVDAASAWWADDPVFDPVQGWLGVVG